jgi:enoyl-[acyl-carrier protein] reductase I
MSDFLQLADKTILVMGLANRKSVAFHVGRVLEDAGAQVIYTVRNMARREKLASLLAGRTVLTCDVEFPDQVTGMRDELARGANRIHGLVHSIAFADYGEAVRPFHETTRTQFLRSMEVSCFSLVEICRELRPILDPQASVVATSISTTRMASENYGFMGPIKAALDSSLAFLAKSFSGFSQVRFNAVAPGLLKTSASAGIPGYVDSYLFAEQVIPRKQAVTTSEVAHVAAFLLSPRSSGINAQVVVVDAGMSINYFDTSIVRNALRGMTD